VDYLPLAPLRPHTSIPHFAFNKNKRQKEKAYLLPLQSPVSEARLLATAAIRVQRTIRYWLVDDDIAVTDFDVVQAGRIGTHPRLVLDGSSLAAEIRKRNQITFTALATPGKCILHEIASFLLTRG
jgi:hypothetical protein